VVPRRKTREFICSTMKELNTREDLILAFLSALSNDELRYVKNWINNKSISTPTVSLPKKITILYGTETGNAKKIAGEFAILAKKKEISAKIIGTENYKFSDLSKEDYLFIIISTQGEGEPPQSAKKFYDYIHSTTEKYPNLKYAVLGLGDTSYPLYCQTGIDVDSKFSELGANRILELFKADVDYKPIANEWMDTVLLKLLSTSNSVKIVDKKEISSKEKSHLYSGKIRSIINLNDNRSDKKTYHIEVECESEVHYQSGDIASILPINDLSIVEEILLFTKIDPYKIIELSKKKSPVRDLLLNYLSITYLSESVIKSISDKLSLSIPSIRLDLLDLIKKYSINSPEEFEKLLQSLNPLSPRQYSIASSPIVNQTQVHLTVALDRFQINDQMKYGLCSKYLCGLEEGQEISFTIKKNPHFHLPDSNKDIILIGPGTGIAPFRAFVAERSEIQAKGKNWLFFGDRKFTENFLYQTEWQEHFAMGVLSKINLAWSRDGKEKYYVQDEIRREGREFVEWLDNGAYIYVCGSKDPMSIDVEKAIIEVISINKKISLKKAKSYLEKLESESRYRKDVY
jgi:sulfite reductase (NADPH) flavoprotein alpha-component